MSYIETIKYTAQTKTGYEIIKDIDSTALFLIPYYLVYFFQHLKNVKQLILKKQLKHI